jgi:hypothetical protein
LSTDHRTMRLGVMLIVASTGCRQIRRLPEATMRAPMPRPTSTQESTPRPTSTRESTPTPGRSGARPGAGSSWTRAAAPASIRAAPTQRRRVRLTLRAKRTRRASRLALRETNDAHRSACPSSVVTNAGGQTCGPVFSNLDCTSCCCKEFKACDDDLDCVRQFACVRQCQSSGPLDQACFEACTGRQPDPLTPTVNIGACAQGPCQTSCGGPDWTCLGHVWPPQSSLGPRKLYGTVLRDSFVDFIPLGAGFHVKMCLYLGAFTAQGDSGLDPCAIPLDDAVSDDGGNVILDLGKSAQVSSYFEVTAPPGLDYPKTLFFPAAWTLTHSLYKVFYLDARNSNLSLPASDPGRGGIAFRTFDCRQVLNLAAGVEVTAVPAGSVVAVAAMYARPGLIPDQGLSSTSSMGIGIITNLPAGPVMLFTRRHDTGELIGKTPIVIQPDGVTVVELVPTP